MRSGLQGYRSQISSATSAAKTLTGLSANTTYYMRVQAINFGSQSTSFTPLPSALTLASPLVAAAPTNIQATQITTLDQYAQRVNELLKLADTVGSLLVTLYVAVLLLMLGIAAASLSQARTWQGKSASVRRATRTESALAL